MKQKKVRQRKLDITRWRIEMLGRGGGFAHRYIAARAFDVSIEEVTPSQLSHVAYCLRLAEVKVTDWRLGRTLLATSHANGLLRPKKSRRAAS